MHAARRALTEFGTRQAVLIQRFRLSTVVRNFVPFLAGEATMQWITLSRLFRGERGMQKADLYGQISAIHKAQAVIEFLSLIHI